MKTDVKVLAAITSLDRLACKLLLNDLDIAVYDTEETYELRDAVEANYLDGSIDGATIIMEYNDQ